MARNTQPILKRCKTLGIEPAAMGVHKKSNRNPKQGRRKQSEYGLQDCAVEDFIPESKTDFSGSRARIPEWYFRVSPPHERHPNTDLFVCGAGSRHFVRSGIGWRSSVSNEKSSENAGA